ncbi:hypothetical protein L484_015245 [Morus notabilis]|uniref:Remorin C-terminal domain-containing protein n=1 Tax=Morus notabilis TaxID=981085 RepID=W9S5B9_9ROSA|nr:remorin [Morus notabilis]EXC11025.1 hypothetical protein L484_015245 [Morus notabilis]
MSQDYDARESDFATAVAAAAFAVHSLDQAELQYQKRKQEALEISRSKAKSRKDEITAEIPSSSRPTRLFSGKEAKTAGEVSMRRSVAREDKVSERASPAKQPSRASSVRQATPADRYQMQKGTSSRQNGIESKADAWEKAQMKKVQSWNEKSKSAILAWENEKKMQAKLKMEKRKSLLEQRRAQNMQHYQNKVVRIEKIAGGARAQLEEKRRKEELAVKDKAKKTRSGGNVPLKCFCFTC